MLSWFKKLYRKAEFEAFNLTIYGKHSHSWTLALGPEAEVWQTLKDSIGLSVQAIEDGSLPTLEPHKASILLPLMEHHAERVILENDGSHHVLLADLSTLYFLKDKKRFADFLLRKKLSHLAPTHYSDEASAVFPCVLKRTDLNASHGVLLVESLNELRKMLVEEMWCGKSWLLQEYIEGDHELVVHCVVHSGKIVWHCVYEYELLVDEPIRRGNVDLKEVSLSRCELRLIESVLYACRYSGPCNIDVKRDAAGKLKILEVNPRLGGSLMREENRHHLIAALCAIIQHARKPKVLKQAA